VKIEQLRKHLDAYPPDQPVPSKHATLDALLKVAEAAVLVKAANARRANALVQDRCERTDYEQSMGYACDQLTRALEELERA